MSEKKLTKEQIEKVIDLYEQLLSLETFTVVYDSATTLHIEAELHPECIDWYINKVESTNTLISELASDQLHILELLEGLPSVINAVTSSPAYEEAAHLANVWEATDAKLIDEYNTTAQEVVEKYRKKQGKRLKTEAKAVV